MMVARCLHTGVFGHRMTLQQLTPDFLDVLQNASVGN